MSDGPTYKDCGLPNPYTAKTEIAKLRADNERLRAALQACDTFVKRNHNANGGWWNDPAVWKLVTEHIEPVLKARRALEDK